MNTISRQEYAAEVFGVAGRMFNVVSAADGRILNQKFKTATKEYTERGTNYRISAEMRFDDECNNGHETFSITGSIYRFERGACREDSGGCLHDEIAKHFPALAPLIKWHLVSTNGPMHYIANTLYWLGMSGYCDGKAGSPPNIANARSCAVWVDMPDGMSKTEATRLLDARLPALMAEFKAAMLDAGFVYPSLTA